MKKNLIIVFWLMSLALWGIAQMFPFKDYRTEDGLASTQVRAMIQDRSGYIWFAGNRGISRFNGHSFRNYSEQDGLKHLPVRAVAQDPHDRLWIGTLNGPHFYDPSTDKFLPAQCLASEVLSLAVFDGNLLCLLENGQIMKCIDSRFEPLPLPQDVSNPSCMISSQNHILCGTTSGNLLVFTPGSDGYSIAVVSVKHRINSLVPGSEGAVWLATDGGLFQYNFHQVKLSGPIAGTRATRILTVLDAGGGELWIGNSSGLQYRKKVRIRTCGLSGIPVWASFQDREGNLWFGTDHGVSRLINDQIEVFGAGAGPQATVHLNHVEITNSAGHRTIFRKMDGIELQKDCSSIRFFYDVLFFKDPESITTAPRLEGFEQTFPPAHQAFYKDYTNLDPGRYRFEVQVLENGRPLGVFGLATFQVARPVWQSPLFIVFIILLVGLTLFWIIRLRCQTLEKEKKRLARALIAKTSELDRKNTLVARLAVTDELTGLHNRRFIFNIFQKELRRLGRARSGEGMAVLILGMDHMQKTSSKWGVKTGDVLLQHVARCLKACLRSTDVSARLGGEEFFLILPQTQKSGAVSVAEKIRKTISFNPLEIDGQTIHFTVSIGVAVAESPISYSDKLMKDIHRLAESMLIQAKQQGRNRIALYELSERNR